jgi:hypothetical protein
MKKETIPFWTPKRDMIHNSLFPVWYSWWFGLLDRLNTPATQPATAPSDLATIYHGVIFNVAKALGWSNAWPDPNDAGCWFLERPGKEQGMLEVTTLDAAITTTPTDTAERARRARERIVRYLASSDEAEPEDSNGNAGDYIEKIIAAEFSTSE